MPAARSLSEQIGDLSPGKLAALAAELAVDHPESARLLLEALGGSRIVAAPDPTHAPIHLPPPPTPQPARPSLLQNRPLNAPADSYRPVVVPGREGDLDP